MMKNLITLFAICLIGFSCSEQDVNPNEDVLFSYSITDRNLNEFSATISINGKSKFVNSNGFSSGAQVSPGEEISILVESSDSNLLITVRKDGKIIAQDDQLTIGTIYLIKY